MYLTNNPEVAAIAQDAGVARIVVDMEYIGKDKRQRGMNTSRNYHTIEDVKKLRPIIDKSELMVRVNPIHERTDKVISSEEEIEAVIEYGADIIMLPYFKTVQEVRTFIQSILQSDEGGSTTAVLCSRYLLDLDDTIIEVDGNFEAITGYSATQAVGKISQYDLVPEADRPYYMIQVNNQFSRGSYAYLRHNLQCANGEIFQILCYGKRYFDSAEKAFRSEILILPLLELLTDP